MLVLWHGLSTGRSQGCSNARPGRSSRVAGITSVTLRAPDTPQAVSWRYRDASTPAFESQVFDEQWLASNTLLDGAAVAGRGNTFFFTLDGYALVLRHYRRGGLVRHLSSRSYWFTGLERTRAMREFDMLTHLQQLELPAPRPYACQVVKGVLSYEASLVTHRIAGETLAHQLITAELPEAAWRNIGVTLAGFHRHGIFHADLNAHNIMIDQANTVSVIDFDRARIRALPANAASSGWCIGNIDRLGRSLRKIALNEQWESGFARLRLVWAEALSAS